MWNLLILLGITLSFVEKTNANQILIACAGDDTFNLIKEEQSQVTLIKAIPTRKTPREVLFDPKSGNIYVNECGEPSLSVYGSDTMRKIKSVNLPDEARGLTLASTDSLFYFVLKNRNELVEWDMANGIETRRTPLPAGPRNLAINFATQEIYVTCNSANCLAVVNLKEFKKAEEVKTASEPYAIKVVNEMIVVSSIGQNKIQSFSTSTREILWEADCGKHPTAIEHDKTGNLLITNFDQNQLTQMSLLGELIKRIPTGIEPFDIRVTSSGFMVSHHGDDTVGVYNTEGVCLKIHKVGNKPHGICIVSQDKA